MTIPTTYPFPVGYSNANALIGTIGEEWDLSIDYEGFLLSTLDQEVPFEFRSYEVQELEPQKPRIDTSEEAGEQTLGNWWTRSQTSWLLGAGQDVFDGPLSERQKSREIVGFLHNRHSGALTQGWYLTPYENFQPVYPNGQSHPPGIFRYGVDSSFWWGGGRCTGISPGSEAVTGEDILSGIVYDGRPLIATDTTGVFASTTVASATYAAFFSPQITMSVLGVSHGRIFGATARSLYEIPSDDLANWTSGSPVTGPDPFFTHPQDTWEWKVITEVGAAAIFAGNGGQGGGIYAASLSAQDLSYGDIATIGALRQVWMAPTGEEIHDIKPFLGKGLLIGTSKGVRVAYVTDDLANLQVTGLVVETERPVRSVATLEDWGLFGYHYLADPISGAINLGIAVIDLTDLSWSIPFITAGDGWGHEYEITAIEAIGYAAFDTTPNWKYWFWNINCLLWDPQHPNYCSPIDLISLYFDGDPDGSDPYDPRATYEGFWGNGRCSHGWFTTGEITFGTSELKELKYLDVQLRQAYNGYDSSSDSWWAYNTLRVYYRTSKNSAWTPLVGRFVMPERVNKEHTADISERLQNVIGKRIELLFYWRIEDPNDESERVSQYSWYWPWLGDFSITEWRLRALPKYRGRHRYFVPIMLYDYMENRRGERVGGPGYAMEKLQRFKELYRDRVEFVFQPPEYPWEGKAPTVQIENLRFKTFAPPSRAQGPGGVCLLVLKEVE